LPDRVYKDCGIRQINYFKFQAFTKYEFDPRRTRPALTSLRITHNAPWEAKPGVKVILGHITPFLISAVPQNIAQVPRIKIVLYRIRQQAMLLDWHSASLSKPPKKYCCTISE
jgi:hypothetical protein